MNKQEIYKYLCDNSQKLFNRKGGVLNIKKQKIFKEINYDFKDAEDLYDFLIEKQQTCRLGSCDNKKRFKSFKTGYYDFCSIKCNNKWLSETRKGEGNPIHRISDENRIKWKNTLSKQVKERIKLGTWTPYITNSWCHSRIKIQFVRKGETITQNVRSSWEAFYQLMNPEYQYEKLRIPYEINEEWHNYIVDFINVKNKLVVEIKPKSEELTTKNKLKKKALLKWCLENQYEYITINEDFFKKIQWDVSLIENQPDKERLSKFKNYFINED